jgi:myo-inositol-1(or 4)-monophosphatase
MRMIQPTIRALRIPVGDMHPACQSAQPCQSLGSFDLTTTRTRNTFELDSVATVRTPAEIMSIASQAARVGGSTILAAGRTRDGVEKSAGDYVTVVDGASERAITGFLSQATPDVPVVGEEGGGATADRYWLVDPLDGTTNFLHGFPIVAVSVALVEDGRPTVGAVHAPFLDETYMGAIGLGASVERADGSSERLAVGDRPVERAVVGTGFPFRHKEVLPRYFRAMLAALERFEDLRRPGAAALDLAWVAAGVFDGFFELALGPWDVAAGTVLIREAGGTVTDWTGGPDILQGDILAGPPNVHAELLKIARET